MFTMERIMTRYIGDWVHDTSKLNEITKERVLYDLRAMNESVDYSEKEIDEAIKLASQKLKIDHTDLLFEAILNDNQVSEV